MIEIFDNILPKDIEDFFANTHCDPFFPWYVQMSSAGEDAIFDYPVIDTPQFTHVAYFDNKSNSSITEDYIKIAQNLLGDDFELHRIKANLTTNHSGYTKDNYQPVHIDLDELNYYSILYYINDSDGDTLFFKDTDIIKRVTPKKGRCVIFNSNIPHAGSNPIITPFRMVVNIILKVDKQEKFIYNNLKGKQI